VKSTDLAFSGLILALAVAYEAMALWMPQGSLKFPGPGYYPKLVGVFLIATSLGCVIQALLARQSVRTAQAPGASPPNAVAGTTVALFGLLVGYGALLKPLGFPIAICLFLLAAIRVFGYRRWAITLFIATGLTVVSYVLFVAWLKVPLPLGIVGDLLD
jgi:putative tricarboxylic transport membrane protein